MRKFEIPIDWTMGKNVIIEAETLEEAMLLALKDDMKNGYYEDESIRIPMGILENMNNVTKEEVEKATRIVKEQSNEYVIEN